MSEYQISQWSHLQNLEIKKLKKLTTINSIEVKNISTEKDNKPSGAKFTRDYDIANWICFQRGNIL